MFKYGKRGGYMLIALIVLVVIPVAVALIIFPQLPAQIPTRFGTGGEVLRWGDRIETLYLPGIDLFLAVATYITGRRQADNLAGDSPVSARRTFETAMRNGLITAVLVGVVTVYFSVSALLGLGLPF